MKKDEVLTTIAIIILLFTSLIDWDVYSWLILVGIVIILFAWYFRNTDERSTEKFNTS